MSRTDDIRKLAEWMGSKTSMFDDGLHIENAGSWEKWNPFTRIEDAWMLVEEFKTSHEGCLKVFLNALDGWTCEIDSDESHAKTAPEAICKAVLSLIESNGEATLALIESEVGDGP